MAMLDYGVITFKNGELMSEVLESEDKSLIVEHGEAGKFRHESSGVVFYRMSIKSDNDVEKAEKVIRLDCKLEEDVEINGVTLNIEEIYPQTFKTQFTDKENNEFLVIHGYDVSTNMGSYWSNARRDTIKRHLSDKNIVL